MKNSSKPSKKDHEIKIVYASKKEVREATKKCLKQYHDVFKELAKR